MPYRWRTFKGIEGLPLIIVSSHAMVYLSEWIRPGLMSWLALSPGAVYRGEIWRLLTFLFVPPFLHPIFMVFWLYLLYIYASALEAEWGSSRFTVFYGVGAAATTLVGVYPAAGFVPNVFLTLAHRPEEAV